MEPSYASANCKAAYQLRWSLVLFSTAKLPPADNWAPSLSEVVEHDGVRLLESRFQPVNNARYVL